jgi:hypothetical protein
MRLAREYFRVVIVDVEVPIARPPAEAFELMADARNETVWNSQVTSSELVSDEPIGLGSRFVTVNRGQSYDATITTYDPPHEIAFDVVGKTLKIVGRFRFANVGGNTVLRANFDMTPLGFMKVLLPLISPLVRRDFPKQLNAFKAFAESR